MKHQFVHSSIKLAVLGLSCMMLLSCEDLVEEGYRIDYPDSDAVFTAVPMAYDAGAVGDRVSFKLSVKSDHDIKSCVVTATNDGASGSGYDVGEDGFDDPFADHNYGTVQKGITSFTVKYDYIIPEGINQAKVTFSVIDDMGKVSAEVDVHVVAPIKNYDNRELFAKNNIFNDAFASIDGIVYPDIKSNYSTVNSDNVAVQEKIDILFYYDLNDKVSVISSIDDSRLGFDLTIKNATRFVKMDDITEEDFMSLTPASLVALTQEDSIIYKGSSQVRGIRVGDIVGFSTDINAIHSFKTGLIKVNGLHPTNVEHYEGTAYVMECDIVTQVDQ
jgi:hypothetical protein